jgi:hypothetical protein
MLATAHAALRSSEDEKDRLFAERRETTAALTTVAAVEVARRDEIERGWQREVRSQRPSKRPPTAAGFVSA